MAEEVDLGAEAHPLEQEVARHRADTRDEAREQQLQRQHSRGKLSVHRRIELLFDEGSFRERGMLAIPGERVQQELGFEDAQEFRRAASGDGVVIGAGMVDGRPVSVGAFDFSVLGGSNGEIGSLKLNRQGLAALENGHPFVVYYDGGGHRVQESLEPWTIDVGSGILPLEAQLSGYAPMVAAIVGPVFGGTANFAALMDFVVMVEGIGSIGLSGPALVRASTGESLTKEELGGAELQAEGTGLVDLVVPDEPAAAEAIKRFLGYLPSNSEQDPPVASEWLAPTLPSPDALALAVPESYRRAYDVRKVLRLVFDEDSLFEIRPRFARNAITAFARLEGRPVGIIANQPMYLAGTIDAKACEKLSHFVNLCDAFGLPLYSFIDVPGFHIGSAAERSGIARRASRFVQDMAHMTVPFFTVTLRKGYGMGYVAMGGGRSLGANLSVAWPHAQVAAMAIEGAVDTVFQRRDGDAEDEAATQLRAERIEKYSHGTFAFSAAETFAVDDVIMPSETRDVLVQALRHSVNRRRRPRSRRPLPTA
ncbi:MAG TPA: carboxyl transferase domain-containing protein [Solirubrobacteraceae bacterium]|jgi:propionyl-CoA carboxylase beta chain|nr:carboxyl transferase domain-containing protein [Solirubrobacteraceae bacterium]